MNGAVEMKSVTLLTKMYDLGVNSGVLPGATIRVIVPVALTWIIHVPAKTVAIRRLCRLDGGT